MLQCLIKYKSSILRSIFIEILGWTFIVGIFIGIWWAPYRWRFIFTSLFAIFLALVIDFFDKAEEEKFKQGGEKCHK